MNFRKLCIIFLLLIIVGCSSRDPRLVHINETIADSPEMALAMLDSIEPEKLNEADRYFYDLLKVKGRDKSFIRHTSDSVILRVKDYYSDDEKNDEYLESLYYCGRVANDRGDFPSAMKYYQEVIDRTEEEKNKYRLEIRGNALTQLTAILTNLGLHDKALIYLDKMVVYDELHSDSTNLIEDYRSISDIYLRKKDFNEAKDYLSKAKTFVPKDCVMLEKEIDTYYAALEFKHGNIEKAWKIIKPCVDSSNYYAQSVALTYGMFISFDLNKYDTAYLYAQKLLQRKDPTNKKNAYDILLRPELKEMVGIDSIRKFAFEYRKIMNEQLKSNEDQAALLQETKYNYEIHDRERKKVEIENQKLISWIYLITIGVLGMACMHVGLRLKEQYKVARGYYALVVIYKELKKAREIEYVELRQLKHDVKEEKKEFGQKLIEYFPPAEDLESREEMPEAVKTDFRSLREKLAEELFLLESSMPDKQHVPEEIIQSKLYEELRKAIEEKKSLENNAEFWKKLECIVSISYPMFMKNLLILLHGKIKEIDKHMALLIKVGLTPTEMSIILSKEKGTISSRRMRLGLKAFGIKIPTCMVDRLIRLL